MKTFSRLSSLTLMFLSVTFLLTGSVFYAHAQNANLGVEGAGDHQIGQSVTVTFYATVDGTAVVVPLLIDGAGLSGVMINGNSASFPTTVNTMAALGSVEVTGNIASGGAYVSAFWNRPSGADDLRARADLIGDTEPAPLVIVVNSPEDENNLKLQSAKIADTFTQKITIENRTTTRTSLPLSAWQMDVVYNPLILKVVDVTEGDLLMKNDPGAAENTISTHYIEQLSSGRIRASQSRPGHTDNDPMSPDAKDGMDDEATASSPAGIELDPGDIGTLLTIQFEVLAVAEEPLGIHNVRLQSSTRS